MSNMKTLLLLTWKNKQSAYQPNQKLNVESSGDLLELGGNEMILQNSFFNKWNPTNADVQKLKKALWELTNTYQKNK